MKPRLLLWAALLALLLSPFSPGHAQEEAPQGPVYIVQAGDTLLSIALRFGLTLDELIAANQLANPNLLFVGDRITIPGLEGVEGVLQTQEVAFGENLRSLSRRYQISPAKLVKLNRLASPAELVAGVSLVLPIAEGQPAIPRRAVLAPGESLLELAVRENANPWALAAYNQVETPARALPGDVLLLPNTAGTGPGGFPSSVQEANLSPAYQGETIEIRLTVNEPLTLEGTLGPYPLHFFAANERERVTLQGIHALLEPGMYPLTLRGARPGGGAFAFTQMVPVLPRGYLFERINVPPELLDPETTQREYEQVKALASPATPDKLWDGPFLAPSPFADCLNSTFGNRRSYNGSGFTYYHAGVDYCGGTGVEIFAPAAGEVVFAGLMEVYGNLTILDHGWGVYTLYLHQSEQFVQAGDRVTPGQIIGKVGNTGRSTGAHLHWEMWVGGVPVNPLDWLANTYP